jgi:hypothetical protein
MPSLQKPSISATHQGAGSRLQALPVRKPGAGQACGDAAANRAAVGPPLTGEVQHNGLMKIIRNIAILFALSSVALATSACPEKKGPAEKAGEKIDKAVDKTKDAAKDLTK